MASIIDGVKYDGRVCLGYWYFDTEAKAEAVGALVVERGDTFNGGFYHGYALDGRSPAFDHTDDEGRRWFAVSHSGPMTAAMRTAAGLSNE